MERCGSLMSAAIRRCLDDRAVLVLLLLAAALAVGLASLGRSRARARARETGRPASGTETAGNGPSPWPTMRANAQNTGQAMVPGPSHPTLKWRSPPLQDTQGSGGYEGPVLASDGTLFCAIGPLIQAVGRDGSIRWSYVTRAKDQVSVAGPAVGPGGMLLVPTVYAGSDMPGLWELLHWNQKSEPGLYALDPSGRLRWKYNAGGSAQLSPVVDQQGRIYVAFDDDPLGSANGRVVVLSPQGHVLRQSTVPADSFSAIALWEREEGPWIYYLTTEGALSDNSRKLLYLIRPGCPVQKADIPAPGVRMWGLVLSQEESALYGLAAVLKGASVLYCMDTTNLRVKWHFPLDGEVNAWPAMTSGTVYVGTSDYYPQYPERGSIIHHHTLYAIGHDGHLKWKRRLDGEINTSPAADARGDLYLTLRSEKDRNNYLLCMRPDGTERWRLKVASPSEPLSAPIIGDQQTVYFYGQRAYAIGDVSRIR